MDQYDLVVIGCGPAGLQAAIVAAESGRRVAIVERCPHPGGAMVNTGTLPSKALRETALLCSSFRRMPMPGLDFTLDRSISVPRFMARRYLLEQQERDRLEAALESAGVEIVFGSGRLVNPTTVAVNRAQGETLMMSSTFVLVATGSSPVRPDHVPFTANQVVDADGILELERLPDSMIVVGGGVIGCEYASIFAEMEVEVTLIHMGAALLPFIDAECRDHLVERMALEGINVCTSATVASIDALDDGVCVTDANGDQRRADVLLWAAGRQSNTLGIGLEESGVEMGSRGLILVDESYQTNVPSVYAAGDVIGFPALASTSLQQGRIAAGHMFDLGIESGLSRSFPMGLYTIPGVSAIGKTEQEAIDAGIDIVVGRANYADNPRGRMLGDEQGLLKCVYERNTRQLVGVTIVGEQATELIHLAQFMLNRDGVMDELATACFNYPSLTEMYRAAAEDARRQIAASPKQRRAA